MGERQIGTTRKAPTVSAEQRMGSLQCYRFQPGEAVIEIFDERLSVVETTHHLVRLAAMVLCDSVVLDPRNESVAHATRQAERLTKSNKDRAKRERQAGRP